MSSTAYPNPVLDPYRDLPPVKVLKFSFVLPQAYRFILQGQRLKFTSSSPFTPEFVQASLTQSSDAVGIYNSRIKGRQIILENPARESKAKKERDIKNAKKAAEKKKTQIGSIGRQRCEKGAWKLEKQQTKCVIFRKPIFPSLTIFDVTDLICSYRYIVCGWGTCLSF